MHNAPIPVDFAAPHARETPPTPEGMDSRFLSTVLDACPDCIKVVTTEGTLVYMSYNGMCAMEIDHFGMVGGQNWSDLWPEASRPLVEAAVAEAARGQPTRFEAYCPTAKGEDRWWDVTVAPIREEDGSVDCLVSVSRDITERRESGPQPSLHVV